MGSFSNAQTVQCMVHMSKPSNGWSIQSQSVVWTLGQIRGQNRPNHFLLVITNGNILVWISESINEEKGGIAVNFTLAQVL